MLQAGLCELEYAFVLMGHNIVLSIRLGYSELSGELAVSADYQSILQ